MLIGVVGKANVGKSTFFKACTLAEVEIANYPFATIKPNHGVGYVRVVDAGPDFGVVSNPREGFILGKYRFVPVEMIDVAGLVPGAYEGKGMGNQFLDDLRQADILIHVIDASGGTNELGEPVEQGSYDPANDIRFLELELDMWYLNILKKPWEKFARQVQQEHADVKKAIAKQFSGLGVKEDMVEEVLKKLGFDTSKVASWSEEQIKALAVELRKRTKPMIIAANKVDTASGRKNIDRLREEFPEYTIVPCSAESELALKEAAKHGLIEYIPGEKDFAVKDESKLSDRQRKALEFIRQNVLQSFGSTGVQQVLDTAVFDVLKYIAIFPGGVGKLQDQDGNYIPDCFLMPPGTTPLDFAFRLHTDFGKNFIKAINVRTKMPIAKDAPLKHRDVVEIMTSK
ncbi:redox-regulated ATPase YchF [Candidatus Woesearchaeota archaeon]|nr:MAG: redox-regulated ATPase YchF [Candidatus Woesearchaeota archaeon]